MIRCYVFFVKHSITHSISKIFYNSDLIYRDFSSPKNISFTLNILLPYYLQSRSAPVPEKCRYDYRNFRKNRLFSSSRYLYLKKSALQTKISLDVDTAYKKDAKYIISYSDFQFSMK